MFRAGIGLGSAPNLVEDEWRRHVVLSAALWSEFMPAKLAYFLSVL